MTNSTMWKALAVILVALVVILVNLDLKIPPKISHSDDLIEIIKTKNRIENQSVAEICGEHSFIMASHPIHQVGFGHQSRQHSGRSRKTVRRRQSQTVELQPGEKLTQTHRSVDLASEQGSRPIPSFIIIGAQKAGTTSLYEYLNQHSLVLRAWRRESHYFDWCWQSHLNTKQHRQSYESFFDKEMLELHPSLLTGESTPIYLLNFSTVIPRLLRVLPHRPKIIVTLRDPVERAYSQYQMIQDPDGTPEQKFARGQSELLGVSFEEVVMAEIQELNNLGITPDTTSEEFATLYLSTRPMNHGGHSLIGRGLYALQLKPWLDEFERGSEILVLKMEDMNTLENTQTQMDRIFNFLGIPSEKVEDKEAKNSRKYDPMDETIKNILYEFYQPFNQKLSDLIGNDFEWKRS